MQIIFDKTDKNIEETIRNRLEKGEDGGLLKIAPKDVAQYIKFKVIDEPKANAFLWAILSHEEGQENPLQEAIGIKIIDSGRKPNFMDEDKKQVMKLLIDQLQHELENA